MKKIVIGIIVILIIVVTVVFCLRSIENRSYKKKGKWLIEKVENYKKQYGELPESAADLNVESEMGEGPYYEKLDNNRYTVYYNIGFDNTFAYYSDTGEWKEKP